MELIKKYFPDITGIQHKQFADMLALYADWNSKINVISRKDFDHFYERHVLHSLAIAKVYPFNKGTRILDVGTGGGFPGIPLAIMFPDCHFTLVDSIGKKIMVVKEVASALRLQNVEAIQTRAEEMKGRWDVVVSRAVTALPAFMQFVKPVIGKPKGTQPRVLYLKGGEIDAELAAITEASHTTAISDFFEEVFFSSKWVVKVF